MCLFFLCGTLCFVCSIVTQWKSKLIQSAPLLHCLQQNNCYKTMMSITMAFKLDPRPSNVSFYLCLIYITIFTYQLYLLENKIVILIYFQLAYIFIIFFCLAEVRPDAILLYGVDEMSTSDVFSYLEDFAPGSVEWIDDSSCKLEFVIAAKSPDFQ